MVKSETTIGNFHWLLNIDILMPYSASEMTYIVSSGALNSTHSLT